MGDVAVVDSTGRLVASAGDPGRRIFARSSMKPLQASVSLSFAPFDFPDREVAVMCASHNAEPVHVETVRSMLARTGVLESELQCAAVPPWDELTRREDPSARRINSDCSGKHAGMLAACRAQGWDPATYREPRHPLQREVLATVLRVTDLGSVHVGIDGCGVPVHGMPLASMALIYARLSAPERWGEREDAVRRIVGAIRVEPYQIAGRNRPDTALMQATPNMIAKGGAEALMCVAVLDRGWGMAVKIRDGGSRASGAAALHALARLGLLDEHRMERLAPFASPPVLGGGRPVGHIQAGFGLLPA
jgi:L-asparaginase II